MATWQDFYVAPTATQGLAQGLGTLGKAYFQKQAQQEQEKKIFDQRMGFMNAMKGAFAIQDPQERETALLDIQLQYPEQLTQFYQATQEQQKASGQAGGSMPSDIKVAEWYRNATPEQRAAFDQTKRGSKDPIEKQIADAERLAAVKTRQEQTTEERKLGVKDLSEITKGAQSSRRQLATISELERLNEKALAGTGADIRLGLAKVGSAIGIDIDGLSESEQFQALGNTLVLDKSQQMSGALSNADMDFLRNTVPTLSKTTEGRAQMLEFARKMQQREVDYSRAAQSFRKKKGYFNQAEFDAEYQQYKDDNPLFEVAPTDSEKIDSASKVIDWSAM